MKHHSFLSIIILFLLLNSCGEKSSYSSVQGEAQGTTYSIKYHSTRDLSKAIDSIFQVIDVSMSTYRDDSELSRWNNNDSTVVLDNHFLKVFELSEEIFQASDSLFDPSVGALVQLYGFGKKNQHLTINQKEIDSILQFTGFEKVTRIGNTIVKSSPQITLDFNAIAQGYTVDVIAEFLNHQNINDFMIEVGGEVRASGVNREGKLWQIGIQNPMVKKVGSITQIISLKNEALATSGNYRKVLTDAQGNKYVHTIHPKTGKAVPSNLLSATVISAESCAKADAYATSLMVMGYEQTLKFLERHPELKVYLVYVNQQQEIKEFSNFDLPLR